MQHTGILILSKTRPQADHVAGGVFQLQLFCIDRMGPHQVEPWRLIWCGDDAARMWENHAKAFTPGTPLQVTAHRARAHVTGRAPEIHAYVITCQIAPQRLPHKREQLLNKEQPA